MSDDWDEAMTSAEAESARIQAPGVAEAAEALLRAHSRRGWSPPASWWAEEIAAAMVAAAAPAIRAAERERIYAELGNDHYAVFGADTWFTEHSVECRLAGQLLTCAYHEAVQRIVGPHLSGRWRITGIGSEGLPEMERGSGSPAAAMSTTTAVPGD